MSKAPKNKRVEMPPPKPVDIHCSFCGADLEGDVHRNHTCKCVQCAAPMFWELREDMPPTCDSCLLLAVDIDDDSLDHMVRG
jgi:hypothetical protein